MENNQIVTTESINVPEKFRTNLLVSYFRRRALSGEYSAAQAVVVQLVAKLDTDGTLSKAIREAHTLQLQAQDASLKLNALVAEVQKDLGRDLTGFTLDAENGVLTKSST